MKVGILVSRMRFLLKKTNRDTDQRIYGDMEIKKLRNTQTNICVRGSNSPKKLDFEMQRTLDFLNAQAIDMFFVHEWYALLAR